MAYAAVTSFMETLSQHFLQSQPRLPLDNKQEMVSLYENLRFLQESLEESLEIGYDNAGAMKDLEAEIRDVLFKAEERIETELSNIYLQKRYMYLQPSKMACPRRLNGISHQAVKQTDYLKKKLIKIKSKHQVAKASSIPGGMQGRGLLLGSTSSQPDLESENVTVVSKLSKIPSKFDSRMVGCDEEFMAILDQLTRQSAKKRQVVSIVGMGGIGKTTLARKVYEDPSITSHFYIRAWVTVSQEYNVEKILRCLIGCVSGSSDEVHDELAESVYKRLKGERYLIVIDDLWSTDAWDRIQRCFPDDNNGSRIVLTSRLNEVAEYASSGSTPLNKRFLDADESWNLYCKVFGRTEFHFVFEQIGRDILKKCEGLPLAIIVVASLLSKTKEEVERWKNVARNASRFVMGDSNDACSRILSLSYNQLPHHLKACFLYFGVFPEDYEIPVKKLVRLWTAEEFLRAVEHDCLEEVAMECLQDLIDRNLVLVSKQSYNGKIKAIKMHDLLRDLCLREARHENLLKVIGNDYHNAVGLEKLPFYNWVSQRLFSKPCRWLSIRSGCFNNLISSMHFHKFYSLHCVDYGGVKLKTFSVFKLVRVVDMEIEIRSGGAAQILREVLESLVHLRYFALSLSKSYSEYGAPSFKHWNLQSFIVHGDVGVLWCYGFEILKMPLLRNLHFSGIHLSKTLDVHRNLETMYWLKVECCTKDLYTSIPNLKKLGIDARDSKYPDWFYDLVQLGQLEKLSIRHLQNLPLSCSGITWTTNFLPNLKKLNFFETMVPWSDIRFIGMLPNLQVLKLIKACQGLEWEPSEGGFSQLKKLVIGYTNLKHWNAVGDHFPVLECLEIESCNLLQEIPSGFADITTLALIQLNDCWDSLLASAKWIRDEQHNYGNAALLVRSKNIKVSFYASNIYLAISHAFHDIFGVTENP